MVTYRRRKRTHALLVGLLVFAVAMIITFADVYGMNRFDYRTPGNNTPSNTVSPTTNEFDCPATTIGDEVDPILPASTMVVPEPTTMMLVGLGLSALWFRKRKS